MFKKHLVFGLLACVLVISGTAHADILPSATTPVITAVTGGFNWDYDALLTSTEALQTGDFFVIYDFGTGSLVSAPVGWTLTTNALSPTSVGMITPTQTSALNFTFTYTGATVNGPNDLGHFVLFSTVGTSSTAAWAGQAHGVTGGLDANLTNVGVPGTPVPTVPEPSSLLLLGSGLAGFAGVIRRKLNR
jgi:hypothetical protein